LANHSCNFTGLKFAFLLGYMVVTHLRPCASWPTHFFLGLLKSEFTVFGVLRIFKVADHSRAPRSVARLQLFRRRRCQNAVPSSRIVDASLTCPIKE
jgi:hypothetical protein